MPEPLHEIEKGVTQKAGPLPVWAWAAVAVGGGLVVYYLFFRTGSASAQPTGVLNPTGAPPLDIGSGGSGNGNTSPTATPTALDNSVWYVQAVAAVSKALGMDTQK